MLLNFSIVLPVWLKTCRSSDFFYFARQNVRAHKMGCVLATKRTRLASGAQFVQTWFARGVAMERNRQGRAVNIEWSYCLICQRK